MSNVHPSDEDLLRLIDRELPAQTVSRISVHLDTCEACRTRCREMRELLGEFSRSGMQTDGPELPPLHAARARLKSRIDELATIGTKRKPPTHVALSPWVFACAAVLIVFAAVSVGMVTPYTWNGEVRGAANIRQLPDPILTPGATRLVAIGDLCTQEHDEVVRDVPNGVRARVFAEYGMRNARAQDYEVDYLITPGLGGADDIRNLWPEPRYDIEWNSLVKDQLEDRLHQLVCSGKVSLSTAQKDVASDWISAYKKYFRTNEPMRRSALRAPDEPT